VPGPEHHFLSNPYGMLFGEITIHSAVHAARADAIFVLASLGYHD
jgi:hypothetical protein